jgi:crotonobetainyl-CoA:carnitine CoA-transferase CaiB-like acyl-CoA transferase
MSIEGAGLSAIAELRVVELGVWVAGPAVAGLLADWGAQVVKVESPTGDPMRAAFGSIGIGEGRPNPAFTLDNRGKRSVVLDLSTAADRGRLEALLAEADVFVTNLRPDALEKLDLGPAETSARHPRLVYCSVSGYGLRGQDRNRPTYDLGGFWARSGLSTQMADRDGTPLNARGAVGDHITGLAALAGVLAAVLEQRKTGRGQIVETSLLRSGAYVLGWDLSIQLDYGKVAGAERRDQNRTPLMNSYRTSDDRWFFFLGLEVDRHFPSVCRAVGRPELVDDPRFADAGLIRKNCSALIAILDEVVAEKSLPEWAEIFEREGIWWAPAQTPAEVVADPQLLANEGLVDIGDGGDGPGQRSVNGPVTFSAGQRRLGLPPSLGEHTAQVLAELAGRDATKRGGGAAT